MSSIVYEEGQLVFIKAPVSKDLKNALRKEGLINMNPLYKDDYDESLHYKGEEFWNSEAPEDSEDE